MIIDSRLYINNTMTPYINMNSYNQNNNAQCSVQDERYANLALSEADKSTMKHHKHGCIAVVGGSVIARGCNTYRSQSSDGFLNGSCSCHAEIDVLRKLSRIPKRKQQILFSRRDNRSCFLRTRKYLRRKKR
jgi:deoxycytidylate deaminase